MSVIESFFDGLNPAVSTLIGIAISLPVIILWRLWADRFVDRRGITFLNVTLALTPMLVLIGLGFWYLAVQP